MLQTFDHGSLLIGIVVGLYCRGLLREMDGELPVPAWIEDIRLLPSDHRGGDDVIPADNEDDMDMKTCRH